MLPFLRPSESVFKFLKSICITCIHLSPWNFTWQQLRQMCFILFESAQTGGPWLFIFFEHSRHHTAPQIVFVNLCQGLKTNFVSARPLLTHAFLVAPTANSHKKYLPPITRKRGIFDTFWKKILLSDRPLKATDYLRVFLCNVACT